MILIKHIFLPKPIFTQLGRMHFGLKCIGVGLVHQSYLNHYITLYELLIHLFVGKSMYDLDNLFWKCLMSLGYMFQTLDLIG